MKKITLGILDQSVVQPGKNARQAIAETIGTVQLAERLGYSRFWISEHHNSSFIAGSAPEVLMVKLADVTSRIRIGSGGIMLPNHSALKVAENFRTLEALFPGRIDLGMGRAPGGDRLTASVLNPSNDFNEKAYVTQISHLQHFFRDTAATRNGLLLAVPQVDTIPMQWILSSSGGSSRIASQFGLGLAVAKFINGAAQPDLVNTYRKQFEPSSQFPEPQALLAISVLCADTEAKAAEMRKFLDYIFIQFEAGNFTHFGDYSYIQNYTFSTAELERVRYNSGRVISGTRDAVKEQLLKLATDFDISEIIVSTMAGRAEDRERSFELLAEAFDLNRPE